jgi:hypothetical protein
MRYLFYAYYITLLLSSALAIKKFNKLNKSLKIFGVLSIATFVFELLAYAMAITRFNNIIVYVVFTPIQIILITMAYFTYHKNTLFRKIAVFLMFLFLVYFINTVFGLDFTVIPNKLFMTENIIICFVVAYSSYLIVSMDQYVEIKKNPLIWINMGILFFLSTSFFIWGFHYLIKTNEINVISRFTLIISNIILYSILALSFFKSNLKSEIV